MKIAFGKLPGTTVEVTTAAFSRSIGMVVAGDADLHLPIIRPPNEDAADYAFSTATIARTMFILYTNKDKPLDRANLGHYAIETEANHVGCFEFPVQPGAGFEASLQKLAAGRIDGFIFGGATIDPILDRLKLTAIHREPYKLFDIAAVIAKGTKGGPIDDLLTRAIKAAADDPAYQAETRKMLIGYRGPDWQVS
jgi:polar amino acid transport system substrate-binding protein